ncbi:MAG: putative flavoprotein involved in transport [Microbacteriaceae bacterium]|nr:putative flavoprotein involved in transport [Microbacteriaceae bacterium]
MDASTQVEVAVIGGGVAGLLAGQRLRARGVDFVILDDHARVGDAWRERYDSLRLFSYRYYASLPGLPMPVGVRHCPTRDELADYLEGYARHFELPVRTSTRVIRVGRAEDGGFVIEVESPTGHEAILASRVIVAAGAHRRPVRPPFADLVDPRVRQLHSIGYRGPADFAPGPVLVVGAGNSGTDIALDAARAGHVVVLAGRHPGQTPFAIDSLPGFIGGHVFLFVLRHLTVRTRVGRAARERQRGHGLMLIRNKLADLDAAGVRRVERIAAVRNGLPVTSDGEELTPAAIVWCTGSRPELSWLEVDGALDEDGEPIQTEGVADHVPGLAYLGLDFQYSAASATIQGMTRDARTVVDRLLRNPVAVPVAA